MKGNMDWDILLDYFEGACSEDRRRAVETWLEEDPGHREEFRRMRRIWEAPARKLPEPDVEAALARVKERAGIGSEVATKASKTYRFEPARDRTPLVRRAWGSPALRAAAMLFIVAGISVAAYFAVTPAMETVDVARGTRARVTLPDGSHLTLDAGSRLRYPARFGRVRGVSLDGEGYFRVTPGSRRFVVRAHEGVVTVLGTTFNVRSWEGSGSVEVVVAEGRVSLRREKTPADAGVVIASGRMSRLEEEGPTTPVDVELENALGWLKRERAFEDAPLSEVLDQVERWYDLTFVLPDPDAAGVRVTVHLENRPVEDLLDMLALVNGFTYEREGKRVVFSRME